MKTRKFDGWRMSWMLLAGLLLAGLLAGCETSRVTAEEMAEMSHDGLERVSGLTEADVVYKLPGADIGSYDRVMIDEPEIAFRKNWQRDMNRDRMGDYISDQDVELLILQGKDLLREEFMDAVVDAGMELVEEPGEGVLLVKPAIIDLYMLAPDPDRSAGAWRKVYAESFGDMTLYLELYDSVTHQILLRAMDKRRDVGYGAGSWRMPRNHVTNNFDARRVFAEWARMFVKGYEQAREAAE